MISIVMGLDATEKRNLPPNFFLNTACKATWVVIFILRSNFIYIAKLFTLSNKLDQKSHSEK